jgi:8-oxo-dGTP diphosphatase
LSLFAPRRRPDEPAAIHLRALCFIFHGEGVLLIYQRDDPGPGFWNAIGGRVNRGEDPLEAAEREVWEEAGIRPALEFRGVGTVIVRSTGEVWSMFLFSGRVAEPTVVASAEGPLRWVAPDEIATVGVFPDIPFLLPYMRDRSAGVVLAKFTYPTPDPRTLDISSIRVAAYGRRILGAGTRQGIRRQVT